MRKVYRGDETPEELAALLQQRRRMGAPRNEMGGVVAIEPSVFRSTECAVQLELVRVFSNGVHFQFSVVVRQQPMPPRPGQRPSPWILAMNRFGDDAMWVGVRLADGRKATNAGDRFPGLDVHGNAFTLVRTNGHGSGNSASMSYFMAPSPPPGPLTIVLAWPVFEIQESTMVISGDDLAAAASRLVTLWSQEPEEERLKPAPAPQPPRGGWFERNPPPDHPRE